MPNKEKGVSNPFTQPKSSEPPAPTPTNAQSVIAEWIETAKSLNRPIPAPKGKLAYA
jgi:hypothetical protein